MENNSDRMGFALIALSVVSFVLLAVNGPLKSTVGGFFNGFKDWQTQTFDDISESNKPDVIHTAYANSADGTDGFYVGGGVNLLSGTAKNEFQFLGSNGGAQTIQKSDDGTNYIQHTSNTPINNMGPWWRFTPELGQVYTISADVCGNGYIQGNKLRYEGGYNDSLGRVDLTDNWQRISNTFRVNAIEDWKNWIIYADNSTLLKIKHVKIEQSDKATPWSPAPSESHPKYIGTYTDKNETASQDPSKYTWKLNPEYHE